MENNTTVDSQAEDTNQSQADETQTTAEQTNLDVLENEDEPISKEVAKKLRSELKGLRERTKTAEDKVSDFESKNLSATEKLQKDLQRTTTTVGQRETGLKALLLEREIERLKSDVGLRATRSIPRLIDTDALEFDLDGLKISGVDAELKRLKKEDPGLFITGGTDGGAGGTGREGASEDMNDILRRKLKR